MRELADLLAGRGTNIELDRAALLLATVEFPELDIAPFLEILDSLAAELGQRAGRGRDGEAFVATANQFLFGELGFTGNSTDYYAPANSCLNEVLIRRTGIPITLSLVYVEIARRLERPVFGVGLPGHFVVQYDDGDYSTFIDPFHRGRLLSVPDCYELAHAAARVDVTANPRLLAPVGKRHILLRMINNLRGIYFSRRAYRKALQILNLLLEVNPDSAEEYKQRGLVYLQMEQVKSAKADLERYLELAPEASDRAEIEKQLMSIKRWLVGLN